MMNVPAVVSTTACFGGAVCAETVRLKPDSYVT